MRMCLYHDDKDGFSGIQRDLQKCGWIPRKYAHRLAMAVCSCRKKLGPILTREEFLEHRAKLNEMRNPLPSQLARCINDCMNGTELPPQLARCINDCMNGTELPPQLARCINDCMNGTENDYSQSQLITILCKAKLGDFNMLSRAILSSNSKISERERQRAINRKKKLTPEQIEIVIKKKKKKMNSYIVRLPIFPGNLLKLTFDYIRENKSFYEPEYKLSNENFDAGKVESFVKVWCDPAIMKSLRNRMIAEARALQLRMDEEREARKQVKYAEKQMMDNKEETYEDKVMTGQMKEQLFDDFCLKVQKSSRGRTKQMTVKLPTSVLDGGHCLQCYKPFESLKDSTPCTFHAGFEVQYQRTSRQIWSCCSKEVDKSLSSYEAHSTTGCTTSPVHNWRTHARAKRKQQKLND